jgi:flagellar protein FlaG
MYIEPISLDGPTAIQNVSPVMRTSGIKEGLESSARGLRVAKDAIVDKQSEAVDRGKIQDAVDAVNAKLQDTSTRLKITRDDESGGMIVQIVNQTTGETLRQIPSAEMLHLSASLGKLQGKLFNRKA